MHHIIILNSHPIQYFIPLYQKMSQDKDIALTVLFGSNDGAASYFDKEFKTDVKWDIPMLEGFEFRVLKNHSPNPTLMGFWGLLNFGIIKVLSKAPKSTVIVFGWNYATYLLCIIFGRIYGHKICLRSDTPISGENFHSGTVEKVIRQFRFRYILFPWINYFLYIGKQNKAFYKNFGIPDIRLVFSPFAVDNDRFRAEFLRITNKDQIKRNLNLPTVKKIILFSGKYIPRKQPMQLLRAFAGIKDSNAALVFVGEGEMRPEMEAFIEANELKDVYLTGFINQTEISKFYAVADIFVMCSRFDAWGLSVNEAMNFNLPLVISDQTCCADDLVDVGKNGYIYNYKDERMLMDRLQDILRLLNDERLEMGRHSWSVVNNYSYDRVIVGLKDIV